MFFWGLVFGLLEICDLKFVFLGCFWLGFYSILLVVLFLFDFDGLLEGGFRWVWFWFINVECGDLCCCFMDVVGEVCFLLLGWFEFGGLGFVFVLFVFELLWLFLFKIVLDVCLLCVWLLVWGFLILIMISKFISGRLKCCWCRLV